MLVKNKLLRKINRKKIWRFTGRLTLGFLIFMVILFIWYSKDLPTPARIEKRINIPSTQILDRNGKLLYAVSGDKKRLVIPFSEMPDSIKQATIALEDQNFYQHFGVDFRGVARSIIVDVARGGAKQGGSTITQQFVKNALLDPKKTVARKIKELILSLELEAIYSKDKILELYLNEIPYGSTSYGIEAASRSYFGKPAKELSLAQAATLASLPQAPTYYSPYGPNKDALLKRKDLALDRMVKNGSITKDQADNGKAEKIEFQPRKDSIVAPHFVFYVQELIVQKYGEEKLQSGGLKITTTLDLDVQKMAEDAITEGTKKLDRYGANNAALVSVEPKTGEILAMVGSRDYFNQDISGQVNVTTSNRQPGSSFKPVVYATAFKGKYNPAYPLFDLTTDFGGGYTPQNYDGNTHGPVTMRIALQNSLNIAAVKTLALVGVNSALETAHELGITTLNDPDRYGLALVLGGGEVKPLEMAGAFSVFGNEGKQNPTTPILKVEDSKGHILEEYKEPPQKQVLDPQVAYLISNVLSDTGARQMVFGFTTALALPDRKVAVKTGTTQNFHDAWTVGYTPQIATAVWVGNTDNKEMKKGADGSVVAAPIWNGFMRKFHEGKSIEDFPKPDGIQEATVDFLSNKLPTDQSPGDQRKNDLFTSWSVPKDSDNIHTKVKINKLNGKLAIDRTPLQLIEERIYGIIHSEKPNLPNWEGPVAAWASANGLNNPPPTDQDDSYTLEKNPVVEFTNPKNGDSVSGVITILAEARAAYGVKQVVFLVDGQEIAKATSAPYTATFDSSTLSAGNHNATATVYDQNDVIGQNSVDFTVKADSVGPVIGVISTLTTASTATLTWSTSEPAVSYVSYGTTTDVTGKTTESGNYSTSHNFSLGGLTPQTTYYYKLISKDKNGNTTTTTLGTFVTK